MPYHRELSAITTNAENAAHTASNSADHWSCYTTDPARSLAIFEEARAQCPVAHSSEHDGFHLLLDHADVQRAMRDYRTYSSQPQVLRPMLPRNPIPALEMDPPRHTEWRALFNAAVTAETPALMEPHVREDVTRHIDAFVDRGSCDLVKELTEPVPAETICRLVGIDDEDQIMRIRELALAMFEAMGDPEEFGRRQAEFGAVTVVEVQRRREQPRDDYLTALATAEVEGNLLDDDDLVVLMAAFLGAGHHSTTSALTSLIFEVFSRPQVRDALIADPALIRVAMEESLRLRPPFFGFFRRTTKDVNVADVDIPSGTDVYMSWASANRDPKLFECPEEFRMDRGRNRHLSFGFGVHTCPGAPLARMELKVVLEELLRRLPDLRLEVAEPVYEFGGGDYAFVPSLPITFEPGGRG